MLPFVAVEKKLDAAVVAAAVAVVFVSVADLFDAVVAVVVAASDFLAAVVVAAANLFVAVVAVVVTASDLFAAVVVAAAYLLLQSLQSLLLLQGMYYFRRDKRRVFR